MDVKYLAPALEVWQADLYRSVKPARSNQRIVQHLLSICSSQHHHITIGSETIHFHQQLVQSILALVLASEVSRLPLLTDCIDLVDENY
jgi:hypothetical protein